MEVWKAIAYLYPDAQPMRDYLIVERGGAQSIAQWNLPGDPPTPEVLSTAETAYDAAEAQRQNDAIALRTGILTAANAAVGIAYGNVSAQMVKALVWILLWRIGALNKDLTVRPLIDWVRE